MATNGIICVGSDVLLHPFSLRLFAKKYWQIRNKLILHVLRAIDGFAQSNDRAAPSMDPLIAHLSIDRAIIDRSRSHLSIAHYCACAIDGGNMLHALV